MTRPQLKVQKRTLLGKKVKRLRKQGIIPANIYGRKISSLSIQVDGPLLRKIYQQAGETTIIDLTVDKEKKPRHTLIRNVQIHPVSGNILHVDFLQVDLKEKLATEIPLKLEGEPELVKTKQALLLQELATVTVEAPADRIPEELTLSAEQLKEIGDVLLIQDLTAPTGVKITTNPKQVVARLVAAVAEEKAAEQPAEQPAEQKPEQTTAEAEKEGKKPQQTAKQEDKQNKQESEQNSKN